MASPAPLDFSLKAPRPPSTSTSPGSSPHSSQSPSSTTHHHFDKMSQSQQFAEALKMFQPAMPEGAFPHPLAGLLAKGPLLHPGLSHDSPGHFDFHNINSSWLNAGATNDFYPASLALQTLRRRRAMKSPASSVDDLDVTGELSPSPKKLAIGVPDEKKDSLYWERRRKNNEAAKRSRDARRRKEEDVAMRAAILEQENLKLRAQVAVLKNETAKLHLILFSSNSAATPPALAHPPSEA